MRTREQVRADRTRAAARPVTRAPVPRYAPIDRLEDGYAATLRRLVGAAARAAFGPLLARLPATLAAELASRGDAADRLDASSTAASISDARRRMANDLAGSSKVAAARAAADVDDHNRIQFGRQVKAVVGIDLAGSAKLKPIIAGFIRDNVARITGLSDRLAADVERMVAEALAGGRIHESLADDLQARLGVTESRAALIAVDQVGKLNGQLNAQRQQDLGVTHFYWRTSEDERVRGNPGGKYPRANPSHWARRNLRFAYADPPKGKNGEPELPGTPIRCRCNAEPDLEDLLAREEAGAADPDSTLLPPLDPDVEADARAQLAGLEPTEMAPPPVFDPASVQRLLAAARAVSIADAPARAADTFTPLLRLVPPPPATPPVTPTMPPSLDLAELARRLEPVPAPPQDAWTKSQAAIDTHDARPVVQQLATAELAVKKRQGHGEKGVNDSFRVTLRNPDGTTIDGLWKPTPTTKMRDNISPAKEPHRERAASLLAEQLGVRDLYPPATMRELDGEVGSVQTWADGTTKDPQAPINGEAMARMRVFDFIIGNTDRHARNVLWRGGTPVMIDHGLSLPSGPPGRFIQPQASLPTPAGQLGQSLVEMIAGIDEGAIAATLRTAGLDTPAIKHTLYRVRVLKRDPQRLGATSNPDRDRDRWETAAQGAQRLLSAAERAEIDAVVASKRPRKRRKP